MIKLSCPSCGAEVEFRSKASVFSVCSFCHSTLVRHDINMEVLGRMSGLQDDLTPLQIGTKGVFDGQPFELIGRLKVGYEDGTWNEWYALSGDKVGWLAEAQGFYAFCYPVTGIQAPDINRMVPRSPVYIEQVGQMQVEDARNVHCLFSEGELPFNAGLGRKSFSVDLTGSNLAMATVEYAPDETRIFAGRYQDFDDFQFQNLREIDGW